MKSRVIPTEYAKKQGARTSRNSKAESGKPAGEWWLRSPGGIQPYAAIVSADGSLLSYSVDYSRGAVRPAFLLNLTLVNIQTNGTVVVLPEKDFSESNSTSQKNKRIKYKIGDVFTFGTYPQTAAGKDKTPIEWIVLDFIDGKALVISKYGLDAKPYNTQQTDITWQQCTLRKWLNGEFLQKAFTPEQQRSIAQTKVCNAQSECYSRWSTRGGNDTQDKIFLLSYREANKYFDVTIQNENNMKSRVIPTEYAKKQGAWTSSNSKPESGKPAGVWWLRSPGLLQRDAADVFADGSLDDRSVSHSNKAVRPAFLLNLESGIF